MKCFLSLAAIVLVFSFQTANAQNLGQAYDWLKDSYKKIPLKSSMPFYDTAISGVTVNDNKLIENARYFAESVVGTEDVADMEGKGITLKASYPLYTNNIRDEEHTYTVNYQMDIEVKNGKYSVKMHDFNIMFLNNKVEFGLKYKAAKKEDGKSNQFMAIFHTLNQKQIKKLCETMSLDMLPADATASN